MHPFLSGRILFPLQELIKGKKTHALLKQLEQSQWLSSTDLEGLQFETLKAHLAFAYASTPYYRELFDNHGIAPGRIKDFSDFQRLPFLTRKTLRNQFDDLRSEAVTRGIQRISTGGSTGSPVTVWADPLRNAFIDAARLRSHRWFDADIGVREIVLWGSPIEVTRQDHLRTFRDRLLNSRLLSAFEMGEQSLRAYCDFIESYRPVKIYGYASALHLLAMFLKKTNRKPPLGLKVIFATAEPLFDFQRQVIEEVFNTKVAVEYGARDAGLMANECPQGGLHIPVEGMIVEVDDSGPDGLGEIVVTNLYSRAMPIIRYRTGDVGELGSEVCPCGRGLPLLKKVEGRQTDFLVTPEGRVIHALAVIYVLRECPDILQFQVVQDALNSITAFVVAGRESETTRAQLAAKLRRVVGPSVRIEVNFTSEISPTSSGKFRYVVSHVAQSYMQGLNEHQVSA